MEEYNQQEDQIIWRIILFFLNANDTGRGHWIIRWDQCALPEPQIELGHALDQNYNLFNREKIECENY